MSDCTHDCSSCSGSCSSRDAKSLIKPLHEGSTVKKVVAVVSGKGGVGKSLTAALLAVRSMSLGYNTALLDADITGPSCPKMFGVKEKATGAGNAIFPVVARGGLQLMSMNVLLENEEDPVLWRGSLIAGAAVQFWTDVVWDDVDIMFIDMPPGTGDVPLSVFQSIPLSGIIVVTTPQDLVEMIVNKAVNMANMMNVPILGLVENMSYMKCPCCGEKMEPFGASKAQAMCEKYGIPAYARMPLDPSVRELADGGMIQVADTEPLDAIFHEIETAKTIEDYTKE